MIALAIVCLISPVHAQSPANARSSGGTEQAARAAWQPVRDLSQGSSTRRATATEVRLVDHETRTTAPAARPPRANTTNMRPASSRMVSHPTLAPAIVPMDDQVVFEANYDGGCDSYPMSGCGCGDLGCDGACGMSMGGCDGMGCSGGQCCNGDPMCGEYRDCDSLRPCITLCWPQDGWFSAEYLMWWQDGIDLPPLASTGRLSGRTPLPNGTVLYGDDEVLTDNFDGMRFDFGFWFDNCHTWGIGAGAFGLDRRTDSFSGGAQNNPLVRPIITVLDNPAPNLDELTEAVALINAPALGHSGTLNIDVDSQLSGWDIYLRHLRCAEQGCTCSGPCGCPTRWCSRSEHRFGFRQVELDEGIEIDSNVLIAGALSPGNDLSFALDESFRTRNQFNGIDFGWWHTRNIDYWNFDIGLRIGVGNTRQRVRIAGNTLITTNSGSSLEDGGLLALNSNIGTYDRDEFSVLPEFNMKLGYQLTDQLRATFGYTFLYWSNVVRPGDQIERIIDQAQVPNGNTTTPTDRVFPRFAFDNTDYWAQGLSFGLDYRW